MIKQKTKKKSLESVANYYYDRHSKQISHSKERAKDINLNNYISIPYVHIWVYRYLCDFTLFINVQKKRVYCLYAKKKLLVHKKNDFFKISK